jgi:hypothetical protein
MERQKEPMAPLELERAMGKHGRNVAARNRYRRDIIHVRQM